METDQPDLGAVLNAFFKSYPADQTAIQELRLGTSDPIYVVGKNAEALTVINRFPIVGIIDDFAPRGTSWNNIPVVPRNEVPRGALVINTSTSISPLSTQRRISELPDVRVIYYVDLSRPNSLGFPLPAFVEEARRAFTEHEARWRTIYNRLADEKSKRVFQKLFAYRLTADPNQMIGFRVALREQYFEPFAALKEAPVFIDCGGFDGDTTEEFIRRHPDYRRVFLFEPSEVNLAKAKARLAGLRDIVFIPQGLSDTSTQLTFDSRSGSASSVSQSGDTLISVTTLDSALLEPATFIKMDLEGWELPALRGAAQHIIENQPILAIAAYHHTSDFWNIPEYVFSLDVEYDLFLRHYTEGWSETVMYFVPKPK